MRSAHHTKLQIKGTGDFFHCNDTGHPPLRIQEGMFETAIHGKGSETWQEYYRALYPG
jgi:hypothetical protein